MNSTLATTLKREWAGELSEGEIRVCTVLRDSLRAALEGRTTFRDLMVAIWMDLNALRRFDFDVDEAIASGQYSPSMEIPSSPSRSSSALSDAETSFVRDAEGLIDWVTRNGVSFSTVLAILGHDVGEISRHDFSLEKTLADFVVPKVSGWAKRNSEPVGEAEDQG